MNMGKPCCVVNKHEEYITEDNKVHSRVLKADVIYYESRQIQLIVCEIPAYDEVRAQFKDTKLFKLICRMK
jgi:hypothetical protein